MAYSDFTLRKLKEQFGINQTKGYLFPKPLRQITPSEFIVSELEEASAFPLSSEKAKSEAIIFPILKEIIRHNNRKFTIFSGYSFEVDSQKNLNGICDYLLSTAPFAVEISEPVFCLVEAKNRTLEEGFGQCAAEMYAAQIFNQQIGVPAELVYGAVTNGNDWIFIKLDKHTITIDNQLYGILDLPELLGAFQNIIDFYIK